MKKVPKGRPAGFQICLGISMPQSVVNQRGMALVLSLVMLVVLSLLGVLALNTSDTELGISANHRANVGAFYAAERAVEYARFIVGVGNVSDTNNEANPYSMSDSEATQVKAGLVHDNLVAASIFVLDAAGCPDGTGNQMNDSGGGCRNYLIEVTAEGAKSAEVQLEAQIAEELPPGNPNQYEM